MLKAAEDAKAEDEKLCQVGTVSEPHKGGRGKVNKVKAIALGKKQGIGKRTMQRAIAKAEGKCLVSVTAEPMRKWSAISLCGLYMIDAINLGEPPSDLMDSPFVAGHFG